MSEVLLYCRLLRRGGPYSSLEKNPVHRGHRGTSLTRKCPPLRTTIGPYTEAYCKVLGEGVFKRRTPVLNPGEGLYPER